MGSTGAPTTDCEPQERHWLVLRGEGLRVAARYRLQRPDAEDIVQETLLRLWVARANVQHPLPWMRVVLRRLARDLRFGFSDDADPDSLPAPPACRDIALDLHKVAVLLPARQCQLLVYLASGMTHKEVARRMSCDTRDVGTMLRRAIAAAAKALERR